jgi:hypothetical protein
MKYVYDKDGFLIYASSYDVLKNESYTLIEPNVNFKKPKFINGQWVESLSFQEIEAKIKEKQLAQETELYIKRSEDGKKAYAKISAEFRLAKLNGFITEEEHGIIEDMLIPVRNEVLAGQWISAKQKLEEIGVVIGSVLYQKLRKQFSDYITKNY